MDLGVEIWDLISSYSYVLNSLLRILCEFSRKMKSKQNNFVSEFAGHSAGDITVTAPKITTGAGFLLCIAAGNLEGLKQ